MDDYLLVHPTDANLIITLHTVTDESWETEYEAQVINLLGRGRKVNLGERWGIKGSLSAQLRDRPERSARDQRLLLEQLRDTGSAVNMYNPFGDVLRIWIESLSFTRIAGLGHHEAVDVDLNYVEVARPAPPIPGGQSPVLEQDPATETPSQVTPATWQGEVTTVETRWVIED